MVNPILQEPGVREKLEDGQEYLRTSPCSTGLRSLSSRAGSRTRWRSTREPRSPVRSTTGRFSNLRQTTTRFRYGEAPSRAAAVVAAFALAGTEIEWAQGVLARAADCPEEGGLLWSSVGIVGWHHAIFVARAATAELRRDPGSRRATDELLSTLIHPVDNVGLETSALIASLWHVAPRGLGGAEARLDLCIVAPGELGATRRTIPRRAQWPADASSVRRWRVSTSNPAPSRYRPRLGLPPPPATAGGRIGGATTRTPARCTGAPRTGRDGPTAPEKSWPSSPSGPSSLPTSRISSSAFARICSRGRSIEGRRPGPSAGATSTRQTSWSGRIGSATRSGCWSALSIPNGPKLRS